MGRARDAFALFRGDRLDHARCHGRSVGPGSESWRSKAMANPSANLMEISLGTMLVKLMANLMVNLMVNWTVNWTVKLLVKMLENLCKAENLRCHMSPQH